MGEWAAARTRLGEAAMAAAVANNIRRDRTVHGADAVSALVQPRLLCQVLELSVQRLQLTLRQRQPLTGAIHVL